MFSFNNMLGVIVEKDYKDNLSKEQIEVLDIYIEICKAIVDENTEKLREMIPKKYVSHIIGINHTKEQWLTDIANKEIKYYGIEILKNKIEIKDTKATIKSSNKIRAKLYEFKGSWVVDSYLTLEKENNKWITKEILI